MVTLDEQRRSVLLARSVPVDGQCLCALALIGDTRTNWDAEVRSTAHAVAAIVATQIRHANDMTALAERQALTRALIAGAPIAVLAMDADGRLIEFNPAAERLSGYRRDDVLGQPLSEILVPERDRPRILEHISDLPGHRQPGGVHRPAPGADAARGRHRAGRRADPGADHHRRPRPSSPASCATSPRSSARTPNWPTRPSGSTA